MAGPIAASGAVSNPSKYGALTMDGRQFTGIWTQRSPYRDAAVPYELAKGYSGTRFDSIWDGLNREISQDLTDVRSPGSVVLNGNSFPPVLSFYAWKYIQSGQQILRTLLDGADGNIYDFTAGQKTVLATKSTGAGPTRFLGLNTELFLYDGVDTKKIVQGGSAWQAGKNILPGTLINEGAGTGILYLALGGITLPIVATEVSGSGSSWQHLVYISQSQVPEQFPNLVGARITFSGLTTDTDLNGQTLTVQAIQSTTLGILQVTTATGTAQPYTPDNGQGSTGNGTTSGSIPAFNPTRLSITQDAGQQWKSYGTAFQNTGIAAPTVPPTLTPIAPTRFWQPNTAFPQFTSLLDSNGNIEVVASTMGTNRSGVLYPKWSDAPLTDTTTSSIAPTGNSSNQVATSIWSLVSGQWRSNFNPGTSPLLAFQAIGYGLNIPSNATILGVQFLLTTVAQGPTSGTVAEVAMVLGGAVIGTIKSPATPITTTTETTTYGGEADDWEADLSSTVINDPTFGFAVSCACDSERVFLDFPFTVIVTYILPGSNAVTKDGGLTFFNIGQPGVWGGSAVNAGMTGLCLIDSNNNLQWLFGGAGGQSGDSEPDWGDSLGAQTSDGSLVWVCISENGSGVALTYQTLQWAYSFHAVDGSVSTASPPAIVYGGILGTSDFMAPLLTMAASSPGMFDDTQFDYIEIWRTAQGEATLVLEDQIPIDGLTNGFSYTELGIPDTSANGEASLNPFIPAPIADSNDPPQSNMTAPVYYLQRVWGIVDNMVVYSGGPDTITGNGSTAFPPGNEIPFSAQPIRLLPVLVQNGGLVVMTTDGIKIILGTGTPSNPFYVGDYLELVSILNYNAVHVFYNQIFCMESNGKVSRIAIEYPFNPQTGYTEVGFPIGDQFVKTTTGGQNGTLFNPATAYVSWNVNRSADTAMYVSTGTGFWFRMSLINPPESGILWSPLRQLVGGASAVQSLETSPGIHNLLIGPAAGTTGPILMRDTTETVFNDNGAAYPSWDAKGVTKLCSTGQWAETVHISTKSRAVGKRPVISVLLGEIEPSQKRPYQALNLDDKSNDPSRVPPSVSVYSDRYVVKQKGYNTLGDCLLTKFDYGTQDEPDELFDWAIYARVHDEREEQVATSR